MTKILFLNSLGSMSRGCVAVQTGCIKSIKANIPNSDITIWSTRPDDDKIIYEGFGVNICQHPWIKRKRSFLASLLLSSHYLFMALLGNLFNRQKLNSSYDILISLNMDGFNDRQYGTFFVIQGLIASLLPKIILRKPIILIPASIGPYKNLVNKLATQYVLNNFNMITIRGKESLAYIKKIGINKPEIKLLADLGFLLPPSSPEQTNRILQLEGITTTEYPLIGFSPSIEMGGWAFPAIQSKEEKNGKYLDVLANTADYLIEKYKALICFIPNVAADPFTKESADTIAAKKIIRRMKYANHAIIASDTYSASEIKGIIGRCDIFFSCRMHAAIAATSMAVPTVVMAYGIKFDDVISGTMKQSNCLVRIEATPEKVSSELKVKLDYVWKNRALIKEELKTNSKYADKLALQFGQLVKQTIQSQ
jgi:colanic acid/amylovoran biosynthesis protein